MVVSSGAAVSLNPEWPKGQVKDETCWSDAEYCGRTNVITLDMGLLVAGTKYRGEFEERLKKLMEEIKQRDEIILFIDEVHTLVGAGATEGQLMLRTS
ncbi:hypothetical protein LOK49_LG05G01966 [Camellia lanceoleosa]|uniref:Uncharacterized protein n=1 Tax=Camellia lanceoleosa TaxID=1840588 RepID=A0ACC0HPE4_9ERIC|nr:hypothetical protein LOK49_LG05G01966 [Camellia lanceoleosa]